MSDKDSVAAQFIRKCAEEGIDPIAKLLSMQRDCAQCGNQPANIECAGMWFCSEKCIDDRIEILGKMP